MNTQSQVHKFGATVLENLPDVPEDIMQGWIENPLGLQRFLLGLCPPAELKVWKTIKLGMPGLRSAADLQKSIEDSGMKVNDRAKDILGKPAFTVATKETEVDLVKVSVAELGFTENTRYEKICERAKELDLLLCPNEVGPQLRLQYKDQPKDEWIRVAMESILNSGGNLCVFDVVHVGDGLWLDGCYGYPDSLFVPGNLFVFVRPRK